MSYWNKKYVVPVGQSASGNKERWSNDTVSQKLDELQTLTPDDPKVVENVSEILKVLVDEDPRASHVRYCEIRACSGNLLDRIPHGRESL